ncbi:hypothetical protein FHU10_4870 [Serratia fonticola]|uniref:Uncharacterized protein n=1 Tax=Serratia fonticola TaxID=47917 RepID=A0A542BNY8_SERFO|nr:hypothetical protein FHU09_2833 [Serratia fonticola]TQI97703.1 hypothetical protein FHU11_3210 [Serratia fonticola]TVZ72201.1 hypothetical protein FHU10_4870 [Serratia fonticola]
MIKCFPKDISCDAEYLQFLKSHKTYYVLNYGSPRYEPFIKIHRAECAYINGEIYSPHTGAGYTKVCANTIGELEQWCEANGLSKATECKKCLT